MPRELHAAGVGNRRRRIRTRRIEGRGGNGRPPVHVAADGLKGGRVLLRDIDSSQFVSALLLAAPYASGDTRLELAGRIPSLPYVAMTIEAMAVFGQDVARPGDRAFIVRGNGRYRGREY
ncbi:MAG TPA: hypothetical protein PKN69_06540, partial [Candidatus Latescibacteria bacterium]|nr:hypothetical protein [Candidatus Latescibacterota bacterium]